ncbi:hypothetical protein [Erythrobacter sp. SD-21]|uniref:hypothetical protein n=1 Tax=Erythrobacter sp. SD-21 TaxID=161528 RepID=UPI000153F4EF|nr:hypothetical protein [Erythrobacter sp. SD-21]EDL48014.1 hypothetical protein ED21_29246 [Erythrobacter sp. SD-21]
MSEQRISGAVDRIERALARIEAQAAHPRGDTAASARHDALKARVAASLSELDTLIESLEQ